MSARLDRDDSWRDLRILRDLEAGLVYHRAGQPGRAERLYRKVLRREPDQPDALRLLGVIASERGRHGYAVQLILLKRPHKRPDRVYPLAKHQEYACVYDWDDRPG